ncbi:sensor histidine kinase [Fodinicola acaciae]|uniref:sensor histidine kinase n=1 Tax=Fodinicola acaciae TaxID=2681555 RepID=UPI001FEA3B8D|nr:sensor histidine kinase [Fodinicola acaciae]
MTATTIRPDPGGCEEPAGVIGMPLKDRPGWWPIHGQARSGVGSGKFGWVYGAIWQVYLLIPGAYLVTADSEPWKWIGLAALAMFMVLYTATFALNRRWHSRKPLVPGERWLSIIVLTALGLLTVPAAHVAGLYTLLYVAVAGVAMLSSLQALVVGVVTIGGGALIGWWAGFDGWEFMPLMAASATFGMWGVGKVLQQSAALRRANEQIAELAISEERARLARDLHDVLGHSLTVISVKAELASRLSEVDPVRAGHEIADVHRLARDALADVRTTVAGYREGSLAAELAGARAALAAAGIEAELPSGADQVAGARRALFGWTLREGVTNVVRHSGAGTCRVTLTADSIEVADDGVGPSEASSDGHGLIGLAERVEAAGGRLAVGRAPEGGFLLRVTAA